MPTNPFGFEKPRDSPGFLLWQTTVSWQRAIKKALVPHKISHAQFVIMAVAFWLETQQQDSTQVAIAQLSQLDKMTVSKALKGLAAQDLVQRAVHATDTRAKSVLLTDKGKALVGTVVPVVEGIDAVFFSVLGPAGESYLIQLLRQLVPLSTP